MTAPVINNPRGSIIIGKDGKAELKWNTNFRPKWQKRYSNAQKAVDNAVLGDCDQFVPFQTGMLVKSGILGTQPGEGFVRWIAPYAKYQYYGKVMAGKPRRVTSKNLVYRGGGQRGSFWFESAKVIYKPRWIKLAKTIAGAGGQ